VAQRGTLRQACGIVPRLSMLYTCSDVEGRIRTRRWRGRDRYTTADMQGSVLRVLGGGRSYGSVRVQSAGLQSMARIQQYLGSSTAKPC